MGEKHGWNVKECSADLGNHEHDKDMPVIELLKMFRLVPAFQQHETCTSFRATKNVLIGTYMHSSSSYICCM